MQHIDDLTYTILNPTGNITALVESSVDIPDHPEVAAYIMQLHPEVEQVGFVSFNGPEGDSDGIHAYLRMAGGEFCGNASMCTAALFMMRYCSFLDKETTVMLQVSGASSPVEMRLLKTAPGEYQASVYMPRIIDITSRAFTAGDISADLPVVNMEGITHIIIEDDSPFFAMRGNKELAEQTIVKWCGELGAEGLGLMFLEGQSDIRALTPLVYVPSGNSLFWENSCASGSAACGLYLAYEDPCLNDLLLHEPGGDIRVTTQPPANRAWLYGHVSLEVRKEQV